jgi:uncharacterized membrane protein YgcG
MDGSCTGTHRHGAPNPAPATRVPPVGPRWAVVPALVLTALTLLGGLLVVPAAAQEGERSYGIEGYGVELEMGPDGGYWVEESIDFVYEGGTYSQGFRTIATRGLEAIADVGVTSPDVEVLEVSVEEGGRSVEITWDFEPRGDPTTFVIAYRVLGALQEVEEENRIAWDAVGGAWEVPIRNVEVRVLWPYLGLEGEEIRFEPSDEGTLIRRDEADGEDPAAAPNPGAAGWEVRFVRDELEPRTPYGVQVGFPARLPGRAPPEPREGRLRVFLFAMGAFLVGFLPGTALALRWRDPRDPPTVIPDGIPDVPLEQVGHLVSGTTYYGLRVFTALLVDLARRGHVTLERTDAEGATGATDEGGSLAAGTLKVHRADPPPAGDALSDAEAAFLDKLAEHDSFQAFMGAALRPQTLTRRAARSELVASGHVETHPERKRGALVASFVLPALIGLAAWRVESHLLTGILLGGLLGLAPGLWIAASEGGHQLTERGARLRARIRARHRELREELEEAVENDPARALGLLAEHLPFMILDPEPSHELLRRLEEVAEEGGGDFELPRWIHEAVGGPGERGVTVGSETQTLLLFLWITQSSQPRMQMTSSGSGMPGGFSGGAGVSTGVGGGGGGMR